MKTLTIFDFQVFNAKVVIASVALNIEALRLLFQIERRNFSKRGSLYLEQDQNCNTREQDRYNKIKGFLP